MFQTELPLTGGGEAPEIPSGMKALSELKGLSFDDAITKIANGLVSFGFKLMIAIFVFYVGRFIIRKIYKMTLTVMTHRKMDPSLTTFVLSLIKMVLYFILIITIIGILGIETSSFLAIFASAGVAIGMALSGTLQNFAGGVLILLLKPYKVGDFIETQGYTGTVKSIQLFHTIINTTDNKAIIVPNGGLSTGTINNYSLESYRRVDWNISLSYETDLASAKEAILEMLKSDERIVKQYIEDDIKYREEQALLAAKKEEPKEDTVVEKPKPWWKRLIPHLRKRKEVIHNKLSDDIEMNAVIPVKLDRSPFVGLSAMEDSSITIVARAWTHTSNYWPLFFSMNERFFTELPQKGFSFPFPQLDVHLNQLQES
ncbi:MAG: mechanosensitive ion channel [Muribaculaceae bacterium]|nr:mechanosensitive ion channel [Muribaculaceae bacterium]